MSVKFRVPFVVASVILIFITVLQRQPSHGLNQVKHFVVGVGVYFVVVRLGLIRSGGVS